ncbi:MAG: OmpA family protein [Proteobacteria bacterium]|nr:OmpA family protein [Pseudomonadota bacterium]
MNRQLWTLLFVALLASSCVKKSVFEASQAKLHDTEGQLAGAVASGEALKRELANAQADSQQLGKEIEALKATIESLENLLADEKTQRQKLSDDLATTIADRSKLKENTEKLKLALAELEKRKAEADARVKEFRDMLDRFKPLIDAGKLKVQIKDGRMVLVLPTDILFASGSAKISEQGQEAILEVGSVLATIKERNFQVCGHTDNVPITSKKTYADNWELAAARAQGVMRTLMEAGMAGTTLSAASYGEFLPVATNDTPEGRKSNRRIDIVVVPDLSNLPGFSELNALEK